MTTEDKDDQELQDYLQGNDGISTQYHRQADQAPPGHVDAAILAASRQAVGAGPRKIPGTFSGRWHVPASIAAVIMLSVLVVFNIPDQEMTAVYAPQTGADAAGALPPQAAAEMEFAGSGVGTASQDDAAPLNAGPLPQLGESLVRDIAEAASNAVAPQLDRVAPAAAPPAYREEAFAGEVAEAITPELQAQSEAMEARSRVMMEAIEPRPDMNINDQVSSQATTAEAGNIDEAATQTECTTPRPQFCTREYLPVCAVRDTGIRCITTPCDSTEQREYGNACEACADPDVYSYIPGKCEQ